MWGTQLSRITFMQSLSSGVSSFLSRPVGFKFCVKSEKTLIAKFVFSASSGLYLVNRFLGFTFVLQYFVVVFAFFFFERRYHLERNLGPAEFLVFPLECPKVSSYPRFLTLAVPLNSGSGSVSNFKNLSCAASCFNVFSASNVLSLP